MQRVLNNSIEFFGARFITKTANILEHNKVSIQEEKDKLFAEVFEQLMLFDNVYVKTGDHSTSLYILLRELGINQVEENISNGIIRFLFWKPYLVCRQGRLIGGPSIRIMGDNSGDVYDDSEILGTDPILVSNIAIEEKGYDLEKIIDHTLQSIHIHPDRKRILKRIVIENYIIPTIDDAEKAKSFAIDSYKKNKLEKFGLPFSKKPEMLGSVERQKLLGIAYDYFETMLLAENEIKKFNDYNFLATYKDGIYDLADSLKVTRDISTIFKIQNIPNLKELFLQKEIHFLDVFDIRELSNAKYFRKWINEKSETVDSKEISREYLNEIKGNTKFFNKNEGKFLKTIGVFGLGAGIGAAISGPEGSLVGAGLASSVKDLGLSLMDSFWLDKILTGKNPSVYIENIEKYLKNKNNKYQ